MKKLTLLLLATCFCIIAITSCKKNAAITAQSPVGNWKWIYTYYDNQLSDSNPSTPRNTGNEERLTFNADNTFKHLKNNVTIDSGTYSYGHGIYVNDFSRRFEYDSVKYYHNGLPIVGGVDYYMFYTDTIVFNPGLANKWLSYNEPYFGGSKWWVKK